MVPLVAAAVVLNVALVAGGWLGSDDTASPTTVDPAGPGPSDLVETAPGPRLGSGTDVPIITSNWRPGDGARLAEISGRLEVNDAGCLHVGGSDIAWPAGFTAATSSTDTVQVRRLDGAVVAETGRTFRTVGSLASSAGGLVCHASADGEVVTVESRMRPLERGSAQPDVDAAQGRPTAAERSLVTQLVGFAAGSRSARGTELPLAPEVSFGLGHRIGARVPAARLERRRGWLIVEKSFAGRVGPFSALHELARPAFQDVRSGRRPHCASPALDLPDELAGLRKLSVQPRWVDDCSEWYLVELFLDDHGQVAAVMLDLWNP